MAVLPQIIIQLIPVIPDKEAYQILKIRNLQAYNILIKDNPAEENHLKISSLKTYGLPLILKGQTQISQCVNLNNRNLNTCPQVEAYLDLIKNILRKIIVNKIHSIQERIQEIKIELHRFQQETYSLPLMVQTTTSHVQRNMNKRILCKTIISIQGNQ